MSDASELPTTAAELQSWVNRHFQTFEGPARAYFELPVVCEGMTVVKRVSYLLVAMHGDSEVAAVAAMQLRFRMAAGDAADYALSDASLALFWRRAFEWDAEKKILHARLSFWETDRNKFFALLDRHPDGDQIRDPLAPLAKPLAQNAPQ